MRTESNAHVERPIKVQSDRRTKLVHRLACHADKDREGVTALFNADTFSVNSNKTVRARAAKEAAASDPVLHVCDADILLATLRQVNHTATVQSDECLLGIILQVLPNHQDCLAIVVSVRIWKRNIGSKRDIAGHLLP